MALPDNLVTQALALPVDEREELAQRLLDSLRDTAAETGIAEAWAAEIDRRAREVLAGEVEMKDGEDVIRRARERLRER